MPGPRRPRRQPETEEPNILGKCKKVPRSAGTNSGDDGVKTGRGRIRRRLAGIGSFDRRRRLIKADEKSSPIPELTGHRPPPPGETLRETLETLGLTQAELAERLFSLRPGIRILYVSGYTRDEVITGNPDGGPREWWLAKPFTGRQLLARIKSILVSAPPA